MRVVSFVPSLTETLVESGVDVVGRTRFCVHPKNIKNCSIVGGTKEANWEKVRALKPDLVVFDREENTREMAEACGLPYHATHVTSLASLGEELRKLGRTLGNQEIAKWADRADRLMTAQFKKTNLWEPITDIPTSIETVLYVIWRNPWMVVSRQTFIGSVCQRVGLDLPDFPNKYPEIDLADFNPKKTLLLLSSEPYPFRRHINEMKALGFPAAMIDGESFSWFGLRSIRFLESLVESKNSRS